MSVELDKDTTATMTEEELAAIRDEEYSPEELAAMKSVAGEEGNNADDEDDDGEGDGQSGDGSDSVAKKDGAEDGNTPDADSGAQKEVAIAPVEERSTKTPDFTPRLNAELPENYEAKVTELRDQARSLAEKYRSGEIEFDEYQAESDKLSAEREALATQKTKAEIAADFNTQTFEQRWNFTVQAFVDNVRDSEKIDYRADAAKQADLDTFVKALAGKAENNDKPMEWFLSEAHKRVKALHGLSDAPTSPTPPTQSSDKPAVPSRKPPVPPVTLSQVPGGEGKGDVGGDEFSDLDGLEGLELEEAIAKMSPAQRERYLRGG